MIHFYNYNVNKMEVSMYFNFILSIFLSTLIYTSQVFSHESLNQHQIIHVYPKLDSEYATNIKHKCSMGVINRIECEPVDKENTKNTNK